MELVDYLQGNRYPGRGIIVGMNAETSAFFAYFTMGRSASSRNRMLVAKGDDLFTVPWNDTPMDHQSLLLYRAVVTQKGRIIVANGDQSDTIVQGGDFFHSLETRSYENDPPSFTPRISACLHRSLPFSYDVSILRKRDGACERPHWTFRGKSGIAHIIHTYDGDGTPLPSFSGEPREGFVAGDAGMLLSSIWNALDRENRVSLAVRTIDLHSGVMVQKIFNAREER
jgi:hypothetical protein